MTLPLACSLAAALAVIGLGVVGSALASGSSRPVLGDKAFAPMGKGFGTVAPGTIFNGGDPSGLVSNIAWHHWGSPTTTGWGKTSIFKPNGGYYPQLVRAELRASRLGRCTKHGRRAYMHLDVREPSRPGGPLGAWFSWAGQQSVCRFKP